MARRKTTKAQREEAEKAALRKRLTDIAFGAMGTYGALGWDNEDDFAGMASEMGLEQFKQWIGGIRQALLNDGTSWLADIGALHHYDYLSKATDWLYDSGIRA
jgi:hypothetical protein